MSEQEKETKKIPAAGESEALFQVLFEKTADAYLLIEGDIFIECNQAAIAMLGASSKEEVLSSRPSQISPEFQPDGRLSKEKEGEVIQIAVEEGSNRFEWTHRRLDGENFIVEVLLTIISFEDRTIIHTAWRDIAERKDAEKSVRKSQERFQGMVETINEWVWEVDPTGKYTYASPRVKDLLGYEPEEVLGKTPFDLMPAEEAQRVGGTFGDLISKELPLENIENINQHKDGRLFVLETSGVPIYDNDGNLTGYRGTDRDITEQKKLQTQVQEASERRGYQVQISTEISQEISQATELSELFDSVVRLSKEVLGYYHTQLLRYDPTQDAVILIAGYGKIGQKMSTEGHRMAMGSGLIGTAAATGETVMRSTLAEDPDWQPNPLLPDTQGEIAVPIKLGDEILGVLDIQSDTAGALTKDDQLLLEGLCGQIAIAMEQTRLRQEADERLQEVNRLYQAMNREGWQSYRETGNLPDGFIYDQSTVQAIEKSSLAEELFANIPMALPGGEVLGELGIIDNPQNPLSEEDKSFLKQVSEQVALALESARLFEQTQEAWANTQSALNEAERLGSAVEQSVDGMAIADMKGNIQFVNRAWAEMHGYETDELVDKPMTLFHSKEQFETEVTVFNDAVTKKGVNQGEIGHKRKDGSIFPTWMTVSVMMSDDGVPTALVASAQDITERKDTEKAIAKRTTDLATVAEVSTAAAKALNIDDLLQGVVDLTRKRFGLYHVHIYLLDEQGESLQVQACGWEEGSPRSGTHGNIIIPLSAEKSIIAQATRNRQAVVVNNTHKDPNWLPNELMPDTRSEMAIPLIVGDDLVGIFDIQATEIDRFTDEDVNIQTTLASQVAVALQNARSFQQAKEQAEQETMLNVISQRIQGTTSVEDALQVAVRELGRALGAKQASIQLDVSS